LQATRKKQRAPEARRYGFTDFPKGITLHPMFIKAEEADNSLKR
jgi:hypothetical protein